MSSRRRERGYRRGSSSLLGSLSSSARGVPVVPVTPSTEICSVKDVAQVEEPGERGGTARARGGVGAPERSGHPRRRFITYYPAAFFNRQPHRFLPVAFLPISPPFDQSLLPFLGSCHEDLVELMLDPRINPEAADQLFGPSDAGPSDAEAADRPFGPSNADKTRPAQPPRGVPLPSIILPSIRIPVALPCLVFIVGVQSTKPFPASDCFKKGCFCWATGTKPTDPGLWPGEIDSHIRFAAGVLVFCRQRGPDYRDTQPTMSPRTKNTRLIACMGTPPQRPRKSVPCCSDEVSRGAGRDRS